MTSYTLWLSKKYVALNDAALLLVNIFPSDVEKPNFQNTFSDKISDILASRYRLKEAILDFELIGYKRQKPIIRDIIDDMVKSDFRQNYNARLSNNELEELVKKARDYKSDIDFSNVVFLVNDVCEWTKQIGLNDNFFAQKLRDENKKKSNYSNKLQAANDVYNALSNDPTLIRHKSVKQAAVKWLEQHAREYDLLTKDDRPIALAIEEIAKIVNWNQEGGAPTL